MNEKLLQMMYQFEHSLLPRFFFDEDINLVADAHDKPEIVFMLFDDLCQSEGVQNPYTVDDFKCGFFKMTPDGKWLAMVIRFPYPQKTPLCYYMYLFFDSDYNKRGCFTLEHNKATRKRTSKTPTADGKVQRHTTFREEDCGFLCAWTKDHAHQNYGSSFLDEGIDFCTEAFKIHLNNFKE
jgi:hypothetical protein